MTNRKPFILGLTGSIGMGKSAVAAMFHGLDVPVFDADAAVHELQGPSGKLLPAIEAAFPGTTGSNGVDRQKLGAAVFGDPESLKRLEAIVHPAVAAMRGAFLTDNADEPLIVFDIPLLFVNGEWDEYTSAKEAMFFGTDTADAPWTVVKSDCKKRARLNAMRYVLHKLPYANKDVKTIGKLDSFIVGRAHVVYERGEHPGSVL